ncbi:MAG: hypothetical protein COA97_00080 [Flavobacteriales bacterium]|nr:MAG: hypothetical protein COA97_00080 [Flavobacteriales bacterium]
MKFIFLVLSIIFPLFIFAGGPWLTPKKSGFFQLQSTLPIGNYDKLFLENNKELKLNRNQLDFTFQSYLEYGITDNITLITGLPYKYISTGNVKNNLTNPNLLPKGNLSGFGNYKLGFKFRVSDKKLKVAMSIQSSFKTISKDLEKGLITGLNSNSIGLYTHIGKSFSNGKLYSFIEGGYNTQSNNFSDFIEVHYELGYQFKPSFWGVFTLDLRESLKGGSFKNENLRQTGFYTNNQEYFAFGLKGAYELKNKIGFTAATFGAFSGNYVAFLATVSIGVYKKW